MGLIQTSCKCFINYSELRYTFELDVDILRIYSVIVDSKETFNSFS